MLSYSVKTFFLLPTGTMFGLINLTRAQRLVLGIFVLLLVDIIWVASSELTEVGNKFISLSHWDLNAP